MRSVDEVREAKLDEMRSVLAWPGMWALDGRAMQGVAQGILGDLCFIDERDDDAKAAGEGLHVFGKTGVEGAFQAVFGDDCNFVAEVASVLAEQFAVLGYLNVGRRLSELEWRSLAANVADRYEETDTRKTQVVADLGEPSFVVDERVLCYVNDSNDKWIFFDFWEPYVSSYNAEQGGFRTEWAEDPLLRDVRVPAASFNESLIMTKYGKVLRWGPGWWLHTQPAKPSNTPDGVREQLQDINAADPSQSLGPRRP